MIAFFDADAVRRAIGYGEAVRAIEEALRGGFDPAGDIPRQAVPLDGGEFLLMPSQTPDATGIKVLTVAPENPGRGMPRIQGLYLLFDPETLAPVAALEGAALTEIRTPAVSMAAVRPALVRADAPLRVVVSGTGPQGRGHVDALTAAVNGVREIDQVTAIVRQAASDLPPYWEMALASTPDAGHALATADVIICATTARTPLFDSAVVRDDAIVIAVGSHEPDARELDSALMGRAQVVVEDAATALRECGDVVMAVTEGVLAADALLPMADVVRGEARLTDAAPVVFKSSGMSWEDLVIARAIASA